MEVLVTAQEMAELDAKTIDVWQLPGRVLMESAGRGVARLCHQQLRPGARVVIACGKGNNGGDGYVVARALHALGHRVSVFLVGSKKEIRGDAAGALGTMLCDQGVELNEIQDEAGMKDFADATQNCVLMVDALFGTGLVREVKGWAAEAIAQMNGARERGVKIVAVDIPSGVDADRGQVLGCAVRADQTVTFAFKKRGHFLYPGAEHCGALHCLNIGIPDSLVSEVGVDACLLTAQDGPELVPRRARDVHKGALGHVVVVAGSAGTPGAAVLALKGALRGGAGLVSWALEAETLASYPPWPPDVMLRLRKSEYAAEWAQRCLVQASAAVVGPGWGFSPERAQELGALFDAAEVPLCLDADALTILAQEPSLWEKLPEGSVLTPHPGEMGRLMGLNSKEIQGDRCAAALKLAESRRCTVVLKGAGTVIAHHDGQLSIVKAGSPALATGGTGDVLAGLLGAQLAQGIEPHRAAQIAVLAHGRAGEIAAQALGESGVTASDVVEGLGSVWQGWGR